MYSICSQSLNIYFVVLLRTWQMVAWHLKQLNLAAVRNMQISLGLPDPRDHSSLPMLRGVQAGTSWSRVKYHALGCELQPQCYDK